MNIRHFWPMLLLMACGGSSSENLAIAAPVTVQNRPTTAADASDVRCDDFGGADGPVSLTAPAHVAGAPPSAHRTESGIATCVIKPSESEERPQSASDRVTVHYTGWTTDGERFDSSVERDSPATFPLSGVIAGWTEGVQLMRVGERRRLWIPEELAYMDRPGPAGVLVFDIELLSVERMPEPPHRRSARQLHSDAIWSSLPRA